MEVFASAPPTRKSVDSKAVFGYSTRESLAGTVDADHKYSVPAAFAPVAPLNSETVCAALVLLTERILVILILGWVAVKPTGPLSDVMAPFRMLVVSVLVNATLILNFFATCKFLKS